MQISVAQSLLTDALSSAKDKHPLDAQYEQLRCKLEVPVYVSRSLYRFAFGHWMTAMEET